MSKTRALLSEYGYKPRKGRGQNFLTREAVLKNIVEAARIEPGETVIEIGPGPGNLTRHLVKAADRVIAIELEHELCAILKAELKAENLTIMEQNALETDFSALSAAGEKIKVVAILPYNITTPVLFKLLAAPELFSQLLLLVQLEVAKRIVAEPGKKPYGILAAQCRLAADCEIVFEVPPEAFTPRPKVKSALVRLSMLERPRAKVLDRPLCAKVVRAAFARRRKTLRNSFNVEGLGFTSDQVLAALESAGIDPGRRAETVTVTEFAALANALFKFRDSRKDQEA